MIIEPQNTNSQLLLFASEGQYCSTYIIIITYCTFFLSVSCSLSWLLLPGWMVDFSFSRPVASTDRPSVRFSSASMAVVRGFTGWGLDRMTTSSTHIWSGIALRTTNTSVAFQFYIEDFQVMLLFIWLPYWRSEIIIENVFY